MAAAPGWFKSEGQGGSLVLCAGGPWTIDTVGALDPVLRSLSVDGADRAEIDAALITDLDTAGAWLLYRTRRDHAAHGVALPIIGLDSRYAPLIDLVAQADAAHAQTDRPRPNALVALVNRVGRSVCEVAAAGVNLLNFFGMTIMAMARTIIQPRRLRVTALVNQIEQTGLNAMGIVGLLLFLIGVVLAFQGAEQLRRFAAEIFTADGLAVLVLREIGVLIAAILVAGRSGSAFTAEIGMMKVNEEIDALSTIGIDPIEVLVLPRINALLITLPLLTFFADAAALAGGTIMSVATLDVSYTQFARQLADAMSLKNLLIGLVKAPVFAFLIGMVGCYEGLRVTGSAESIGRQTTKSVVESIVLVIIADALFSIVFAALGV
ncbi:MAG: putative phospholipid ABC transporter permease protein MlaE [Alphaproteobacteria bacterium MarineAlpha10_Bin3]|nr:MAG: putative phospholipid ABC transporter permease protein MlaE [Alphaproteobacteria bacterium MarineAlpha10_Bin3]PPR71030.1 MAG: putative phospholipid ABC transporter permease protein MlaE [Alphaproteobacteria bacterium MarineAlpha4_Bin1]